MVLILVDYDKELSSELKALGFLLYLIFLLDFILRYRKAKNKRWYLENNIFDLLALIPFHGILPPLPVPFLEHVLSALNLTKALFLLVRPFKKVSRFMNTNGFKYILLSTFALVITGGFLIHYAEGMTFADGIWWAFVTATTVGYGDISPSTFYGRVIAMALMLVGIGLLGSVTSTLTSFFMERRDSSVRDDTLTLIQDRLNHFDELSLEDVEEICILLRAMKSPPSHPSVTKVQAENRKAKTGSKADKAGSKADKAGSKAGKTGKTPRKHKTDQEAMTSHTDRAFLTDA